MVKTESGYITAEQNERNKAISEREAARQQQHADDVARQERHRVEDEARRTKERAEEEAKRQAEVSRQEEKLRQQHLAQSSGTYGKWQAARDRAFEMKQKLMRWVPPDDPANPGHPIPQSRYSEDPDWLEWNTELQKATDEANTHGSALSGFPDLYTVGQVQGITSVERIPAPTASTSNAPPPATAPLPGRKSGKKAASKEKTKGGKTPYTMAQIQARIDPKTGLSREGKRLEEILNAMRNDPRVEIVDDPNR
jgi:hypothetical protein